MVHVYKVECILSLWKVQFVENVEIQVLIMAPLNNPLLILRVLQAWQFVQLLSIQFFGRNTNNTNKIGLL